MRRLTDWDAPDLERDLVQQCKGAAEAMHAFLAEVGQKRAKNSGTTLGYPDLTLMCNGHTVLIEVKRTKAPGVPKGILNLGQIAFIERAAEQGVEVRVIETLQQFVDVVNECRQRRRK